MPSDDVITMLAALLFVGLITLVIIIVFLAKVIALLPHVSVGGLFWKVFMS